MLLGHIRATLIVAAALAARPAAAMVAPQDLSRLSLEELSNLEITSVSKRPEPVSAAPGSIYVITPDAIRSAGALALPEALALAPNLDVRQVNAGAYAISARGFNGYESANKLLAMIDGRTIYSPLHSGVFWDNYDVLLADLARIEVISGPGGALWGANAVNGVINVITKSSRETQGALAEIGGGTQERLLAGRYGGRLNDGLTYRVYVKALRRGETRYANGQGVGDTLADAQGGFRADWQGDLDTVTVQGDFFSADSEDVTLADQQNKDANVLARWRHEDGDSATMLQVYADGVRRRSPGVKEWGATYDVEAQHNRRIGAHELVIGGGYRRVNDTFTNTLNIFVFDQPRRTIEIANLFAQDTVNVTSRVRAIAGIKFEHNDFTGWEVMPSLRVAFAPQAAALLWAAVSRAVRTPSRIDRELQAPPLLIAATDFRSEQLTAYEAGYRQRLSDRVSVSVSAYYDVYHDIRDTGFAPGGGLPIRLENAFQGHVYGVESWASLDLTSWWRLEPSFTALHRAIALKPGHIASNQDQSLGDDPSVQGALRSRFALGPSVDWEIDARFLGRIRSPLVPPFTIPGYTVLNTRLAWRPNEHLEFAISGKNLMDEQHPETGRPATRPEIRRSVYASVRWSP